MKSLLSLNTLALLTLPVAGWLLATAQKQHPVASSAAAAYAPVTGFQANAARPGAVANGPLAMLTLDFHPAAGEAPIEVPRSVITRDALPAAEGSLRSDHLMIDALLSHQQLRETAAFRILSNPVQPTFETSVPSIALSERPLDREEFCGWADGTKCHVVPIPGLRWETDPHTAFGLSIAHQQLGDATDIAVMGMLSMQF